MKRMATKKINDTLEFLNDLANGLENEAQGIIDEDVTVILAAMTAVRSLAESLKYIKKRYSDLFQRYKEVIVPEKFQEEGITSITVDDIRFTVSSSMRTSIVGGEKESAYKWLRDNNLGDIITDTVNSSTLSATARTLFEDGVEMPEDCFKFHFFNNTSMTKK
jgi:hypothetical protein